MPQVPLTPLPSTAATPSQPLEYQRIQVSPDAFGAQVGAATQRLGAEVGQAGDILFQNAVKLRAIADETEAKEADIRLTRQLDDLQFNPQTGFLSQKGKNAVNGYQTAHAAAEQIRADVMGSVQSPAARRMLLPSAASQTQAALRNMSRHAATENTVYTTSVSTERSKALIESAGLDYTRDPEPVIRALREEAISRTEMAGLGGSDSDAAKNEIQKSVDALQTARIRSQRIHDPVGALSTFQTVQGQLSDGVRYKLAEEIFADAAPALAANIARDPKFVTNAANEDESMSLSAQAQKLGKQFVISEGAESKTTFDRLPIDEKLRVMSLSHTMQAQDKSQAVQSVTYRAQDAEALLERGLPAPNAPSRDEMIGTHGAVVGDRMAQKLDAARDFGAKVQQMSTTPRAEQARLASAVPEAGAGSAEVLRRNDQLTQAIQQVRKAQDEHPADFVLANSRGVNQAWSNALDVAKHNDANATHRAFDTYATTSIAEQNRLGMPFQGILPTSLKDQIVDQLTNAAGSQQTVNGIKQLASEWGRHYPQVYSEIAKSLPDTPLVIGSGMKEGPAMLLAGLTQEKMDSIKKGLPSSSGTDIKEQLDKQFDQGRISLIASEPVSGLSTFNSFYNASEKLATLYASQGSSPKDAAQKAYNDTFGHKYEFLRSGEAYVRVPKTQNVSQISDGMSIVRGDPGRLNIQPLLSLVGLDEKQRMAATLSQVKADGYWVTSPDESGATLYLQGAPVLNTAGEPVYQSWYALASAGRGKPAVLPGAPAPSRFNQTPGGAATGVRR